MPAPLSPEIKLLRAAYAAFNARDIDAALATMTPQVAWPMAFKGGFVRGHQEVRAYWTHQWSEIDPRVEPASFHPQGTGRIWVNVHQVVRDLAGTVLSDEHVGHCFTIKGGLIQAMEVCPLPPLGPGVSRRRVALVTCEALADLYEDDLLLVTALADIGIASVPAVWSDASIDWTSFDALIMRSPWDYFERAAEFRAWLDGRIAERALMCNSREILDWNFDKGYLQDLAQAGIAIVPTICIAKNDKADVVALARARGWNEIVTKPTIAGGGYGCLRFRLHEFDRYAADIAKTLEDRGLLVQPFFPEIQSSGELSLLFFDGVFSHAVRKRPKAGDYRVQFQFGGSNEDVQVSEDLIAQASVCVAHSPAPPVYARVDGVLRDGNFLLMELEVFEPLMFLSRHPEAPARFARAIEKRLLAPRA